ncbi:MAG TPA: hypothetical protein VM364_13945 [Vicinamibacterales bacterium]|nr:hypothetical protein [Vicinamibacterales bacterium]
MNLDEMKGAWQARDGAAPEEGGDMVNLLGKLDALERGVRRRDVREYVAACLVMAIFGWMAATAPDPLTRTGALTVVFGSMFIIVWSRRATGASPRRAFAGDLPLAQFCARELERVEAQIRLLRGVWWWYLAPTVVGILLMVAPRPQAGWVKLGTALVVLAVAAVIYMMNLAAAKHELEPLRDELAARLDELRR